MRSLAASLLRPKILSSLRIRICPRETKTDEINRDGLPSHKGTKEEVTYRYRLTCKKGSLIPAMLCSGE